MNWDGYHISFLNLPHRTDRLNHMVNQLSRFGIPAVRHEAKLPTSYDYNNPKYATMMARTPGALGCHIGQVEIMKEGLESGRHTIVLEDDVIFCNDLHARLEYITKWQETHEWDVFWLGATFHSPAFWHKVGKSGMPPDCSAQLGKDFDHTSDPRIKRTYGAFCTYAYMVNLKSIEKILNLFDEHLHMSIGIDWLFIKLQPQLKCFAFVPGSVKQMDNKSDIGTGMTIFSGFSRLNGTIENSRYWYQENISDFDPNTFKWK